MKYALSLFLLVLLSQSWAQPYVPMLSTITEWNAVTCLNGCGVDSYTSSGDTLVDGQHYQVLGGFHYIGGNFLIREDIAERKVYMKMLVEHTLLDEYPLYDFSLEDGDTTHVYNPISPLPEDGGLFIVDSIVNKLLENGTHRFFYLHAIDPMVSLSERTVWVEGVGSLSIINSPGASPTAGEHLGCNFKDGVLQYSNTDSIESCANLGLVDYPKSTSARLIPTVFSEQVEIKIDSKERYDLDVFDIRGQLVYSLHGLLDTHNIQASKLPNGMLLFSLRFANGSAVTLKAINRKR